MNGKEEGEFKLQYEVARFLAKHIWNSAGKSVKTYIKNVKDIEMFTWEIDELATQVQTIDDMKHKLLSIANSVNADKKGKKKGKS